MQYAPRVFVTSVAGFASAHAGIIYDESYKAWECYKIFSYVRVRYRKPELL